MFKKSKIIYSKVLFILIFLHLKESPYSFEQVVAVRRNGSIKFERPEIVNVMVN